MDQKAFQISAIYCAICIMVMLVMGNLFIDHTPSWWALGSIFLFISSAVVFGLIAYHRRKEQTTPADFQNFFINSQVPMLIYEEYTTKILTANEAALALYQYTLSELQRRDFKQLSLQSEAPKLAELFHKRQQILQEQGIWRHRRKDGTPLSVQLHHQPFRHQGKKGILVQINSISPWTDRVLAGQQLNQQLVDFRFAVERGIILGMVNGEGLLTEVNENFCEITGLDKRQLLNDRFDVTFADSHRNQYDQIMAAMQMHRIWRGEIKHQTPGRRDFWTQAFFIPFNQQSDQVGQALFIYTDITDRKRSEEATKRREEYLRSIVDSQSTYMIRTDPQGRYAFVNQTFQQKFPHLGEAGFYDGLSFHAGIHPEDGVKWRAMAERCLANPGEIHFAILRIPQLNDAHCWTEWEFVGIQNSKQEVVEIQGLGQDITPRLVNQERIRQQNEKLKEIAWISSHELRRPVANILGLIYLLTDHPEEDLGKVLKLLSTSAQDLDTIVHQIVHKAYEAEASEEQDLDELLTPPSQKRKPVVEEDKAS